VKPGTERSVSGFRFVTTATAVGHARLKRCRRRAACRSTRLFSVHIDAELLKAFAHRRWDLLEDAKREHIAARYRQDPAAHVASIHALRDHLRLVRPEWPTPEDLAEDFEAHVDMNRKLDRVAVYLEVSARPSREAM
jgi:hypothetical protein